MPIGSGRIIGVGRSFCCVCLSATWSISTARNRALSWTIYSRPLDWLSMLQKSEFGFVSTLGRYLVREECLFIMQMAVCFISDQKQNRNLSDWIKFRPHLPFGTYSFHNLNLPIRYIYSFLRVHRKFNSPPHLIIFSSIGQQLIYMWPSIRSKFENFGMNFDPKATIHRRK